MEIQEWTDCTGCSMGFSQDWMLSSVISPIFSSELRVRDDLSFFWRCIKWDDPDLTNGQELPTCSRTRTQGKRKTVQSRRKQTDGPALEKAGVCFFSTHLLKLAVAYTGNREATPVWNNRTEPQISRGTGKFTWISRKRRITVRVGPHIWAGRGPNNSCWQRQV